MRQLASLFAVGALFSAGCARPVAPEPVVEGNDPGLKPGMTRKQVVARYGETNHRRANPGGESWVYNLNHGHGFVPWNHGYRAIFRVIEFDRDGRVIGWRDQDSSLETNAPPGI